MRQLYIILLVMLAALVTPTFAQSDFEVSTSVIEDTLFKGANSSTTFSVENTGNSNITVSLSAQDAQNGGSSIPLQLNESELTLSGLEEKNVLIEYTAGTTPGTYEGEILVTDSNNSSNQEVISVELRVLPELNLEFDEESDGVLSMNAFAGERDSRTFDLRNTGEETLQNIEIEISDLENIRGDRIRVRDLEFNDERDNRFEISELVSNESAPFRVTADLPSSIRADVYRGDFDLVAETPEGDFFEKSFVLRIVVSSDEEDVRIEGIDSPIVGEEGELIRNNEVNLWNNGRNDVRDLSLEIRNNFESLTSSATMSSDAVEFSRSSFDISDRSSRDVRFDVRIPDNQEQGLYSSRVDLVNAQGDRIDSISLQIRVTGDIFFSDIDFPDTVRPGQSFTVDVTLENQGTQTYRNVNVDGLIENINRAGSDLRESTSTFTMSSDSQREQTLRFSIPDDATHGSKTLELELSYDDFSVVELETFDVIRDNYNIMIESYYMSPQTIRCDRTVQVTTQAENKGRFDETSARFTAEIEGEGISNSIQRSIDSDRSVQQTLTLDASDLEPGTYTVIHKVEGQSSDEVESTLLVRECNGGIDIDPINETEQNGEEPTRDRITFLGQEIDRTTAVLGTTFGGIMILIVASLFFL